MKKIKWLGIVFASLCLGNIAAFAIPNVGDDAVFNVAASDGAHSLTGTDEWNLVSFDQSSGNYDEKDTFTQTGAAPQVKDNKVAAKDILDSAAVNDELANCVAGGGQLATVTVPAGTFDTCAVPISSSAAQALLSRIRRHRPLNASSTGNVWVAANIAFGMAKIDSTSQGVHIIYELASQQMGGQ